jgi:Methyl-accepting chemotaxis protein-like, first PDC sensor domain
MNLERKIRVGAAVLLPMLVLGPLATSADERCNKALAELESALVRTAADRINSSLGAVARSTRALGDTYARLAGAQGDETPPDGERWLAGRTTKGNTTGLRTWPTEFESPPAFQAPYPGFYRFNDTELSEPVLRELDLFERLVPTFRTAYESFPFSWVYVTTADNAMMIYPYVPIEEAANDEKPTETLYYKAADFKKRAVGWTVPYLDLVGAGMMVTASYPVYEDDRLLGVVSHDITLKELTKSVLSRLAGDGSSVLLIAADGMAIDASDPKLAAEIDRVNTKAGAAVLHYRTADAVKSVVADGAVVSEDADTNALVEQVLARSQNADDIRLHVDDKRVLAAPVERTGWLLIMIQPQTLVR